MENVGRTVIRGIAAYGTGNAALLFVDFIKSILLLRWLLIVEYGIYRLVLAGCDLFSALFLSGLNNVVIAEASRGLKENSREGKATYTLFVGFLLIMGIVLWALFFWGSSILTYWFENAHQYLRLISFIFLLWSLETILQLTFSIFLDFNWAVMFRVLRNTSHLLTIITFFFADSFGVREALLSWMMGTAVPTLITFIGYRRPSLLVWPSKSEIKVALDRLILNFGKWALFDDLVMNFGKNIQPFIVKIFVGTEAVAILAVAQNLVSYAISIVPIREVLTPVFPRVADQPEEMVSKINRATKYATLIYIALTLGAAVAGPFLVYLFFPKYVPSLPFFFALLLGLPLLGFRSVVLPAFYALRSQKTVFILTAFRLILITILSVVLVYLFGIWGAVIEALMVSTLLTPAFAKSLRQTLPGWKFSFKDLLRFDDYDREFIKKALARARALVF